MTIGTKAVKTLGSVTCQCDVKKTSSKTTWSGIIVVVFIVILIILVSNYLIICTQSRWAEQEFIHNSENYRKKWKIQQYDVLSCNMCWNKRNCVLKWPNI